jgi:hypothetical protein
MRTATGTWSWIDRQVLGPGSKNTGFGEDRITLVGSVSDRNSSEQGIPVRGPSH